MKKLQIEKKLYSLRWAFAGLLIFFLLGTDALAHGVAEGDKGYIGEISGVNLLPFIYLGAKHMFTGYDHILFLLGVIFFLYKLDLMLNKKCNSQ